MLDNAFLRPLCVRISRVLLSLGNRAIYPRCPTADYIEWDPRKLNALADDAANIALDRKADWLHSHEDTVQRAKSQITKVNFRVCFDGALRKNGAAAAGLAILAYYPNGDRDILLRGGKLLGDQQSAFVAEALALE